MILYAITNYITDNTPLYSSSEDSVYVLENLHNKRPSKPFRFTGQGSPGSPEWVCVDLTENRLVTFVGIFNTNMLLIGSADELSLKACSNICRGESGACNWDAPDFERSLLASQKANHRNICDRFSHTNRYWDIDVIDQDNPYPVEIGELFLGQWRQFTNARLQPGQSDGPAFFRNVNVTHYGQTWSSAYSEARTFELTIKNVGNPAQVSELEVFLREVHDNGGRFVFIPRDDLGFCYYVFLQNESDFATQITRGLTGELYDYRLSLITLTEGIRLL